MRIVQTFVRFLKLALIGPGLDKAASRHAQAADRLDAAVREVLRK